MPSLVNSVIDFPAVLAVRISRWPSAFISCRSKLTGFEVGEQVAGALKVIVPVAEEEFYAIGT